MASPNATVSFIGQANSAGDERALHLKVFSGEVMNTFEETNVMMPLHQVRTIASGKSAQFPKIGTATASYHTAGNEILGTAIKHNEVNIAIDNLLLSDVFIANIDEALSHYEVRSAYARELGQVLANEFDKHVLQTAVLAGQLATPTITGGKSGLILTESTFASSGAKLSEALFDCAQNFDEKDIPENDRYLVLPPAQYYLLAATTDVINRDWGGRGNFAEGEVLKVAGIHVVKSNHVPQANVALSSPNPTTYNGTFVNTVGVAFHKSAVGTVKLMDLAIESGYDIRRQGTLMVAKMAVGHGILRPESAVELQTA
jgi:hypothetical protein